ncbi:hypothetical protein F0562_034089 [Nyssa sinensis]|uniref:Uncharacterized protein n=1 Tax=Nyssa sinensis TaxID=561372 RepID=A0A5J5AGY9_9ASTE|nr:hypothetical protein F0562_034089 [Nyssa sinensis]
MSNQVHDWDVTTTSEDDAGGQSSPNSGGVFAPLTDFTTLAEPNLWVQTPDSLNLGGTQVHKYSNVFQVLSNVELHSKPPVQATTAIIPEKEKKKEKEKEIWHVLEKGELSGTERKSNELEYRQTQTEGNDERMELRSKQDNQQPKRARSTEIHNISERMMSIGGAAQCQALNMLPGACQNIQVPQFFPFVANRPRMGMAMSVGRGMGMYNIPCSTGLPMIPVPSASLHPSQSAAAGLPLLSGSGGVLPVPQVQQFPFNPSQPKPTVAPSSIVPPIFSSQFNTSNQGESSSPSVPIIPADFHQMPRGSIATVPASQIIPPSTLSRNPVDVEACGADSSQWQKGKPSKSEE